MKSCLDTIFQMGKYQFTSNSFLDVLSKKCCILKYHHSDILQGLCPVAIWLGCQLHWVSISIKNTAAQIFLLSQGLALKNCLSIFAHKDYTRIPLKLSLIGLTWLTGLEILAVIVASAFSMSAGGPLYVPWQKETKTSKWKPV